MTHKEQTVSGVDFMIGEGVFEDFMFYVDALMIAAL